jgi:Domain of unknown function (DUF4386)
VGQTTLALSTPTAAGILLVAVPIGFNLAFGLLAGRFDYPDVLRRPTHEVLERFRAAGSGLVLLWWAFALTAVAMAPLAVLLAASLDGADGVLLSVAAAIGVLAALVQALGLVRWPFVVPYLAREDEAAAANPARREAVDVVFQSLNRYLGVGVGEHLGYGLTGFWTVLTGVAMYQSSAVPAVLGGIGLTVGALLMLCSLEFVGKHEPSGWKLAERLTPLAYVAWSIWLSATGLVLLF